MKNEIKVFEFEGTPITTVTIEKDGKPTPLFNAKEVAELLEYPEPHKAVERHCKSIQRMSRLDIEKLGNPVRDEKSLSNKNNNLPQELTPYQRLIQSGQSHDEVVVKRQWITESDLYRLVMSSKKKEAVKVQDWIVEDVMPAVYRDGIYIAGEENLGSDSISEEEFILQAMEKLQAKVDRLKGGLDVAQKTIQDKNRPIAMTRLWGGNNKLAQISHIWLEDEGYLKRVWEGGRYRGWTMTERGEETGYGSQTNKYIVYWTPDILDILPSRKELLDYAERLDLVNYRKSRVL